MMSDNHRAAIGRVAAQVEVGTPGIGLVLLPPGQHAKVAQALASRLPGFVTLDLWTLPSFDALPAIAGGLLPEGRKEAAVVLGTMNALRGRIIHGRILLLLLTRSQLAELQQHAPDVYSAKLFFEEIPFEPDPDVDDEVARASLARWHFERFGRLDLRGFVRSETEDVSWTVEEIYQDLEATGVVTLSSKTLFPISAKRRVVEWLEELTTPGEQSSLWIGQSVLTNTAVILGHPGSGKTFFLRWLAVHMAGSRSFLGIERSLPLLTSLPAYAQAPGPIALYDHFVEMLLEARQPAAHAVERAIGEKKAVFLLDGLDEVGDDVARRKIIDAVEALRKRAPGCLLVMTSRLVGYEAGALLSSMHLILSPFGDDAIQSFLIQWCELYARDRRGDSAIVEAESRKEGEQLARDVLNHKDVRELARNPLMLTVLAIVHRSGVRLPDHRVELYDHATRVLVERWNRVRSFSASRSPPPLKAADAVRLLGPIALNMARRYGVRSLISESELRRMLDDALACGNLQGLATADEAITLFRNSLGLLVEQGPGLYAFLHLTLAEYFAAWELVRTDALETLASEPTEVFYPEWREVILLASGVLGVLRADDARLEELVGRLVESAAHRPGKPSPTVPSLLGGLLSDDPGLSPTSRDRLVKALVPTWWFKRRYGVTTSLLLAVQEATTLVQDRIMNGRSAELLRDAVHQCYGNGIAPPIYANLVRGGSEVLTSFLYFLAAAEVDYGPLLLAYARAGEKGRQAVERVHLFVFDGQVGSEGIKARFRVSRILDDAVRSGVITAYFDHVFIARSGPNPFVTDTVWRPFTASGRKMIAEGEHAWLSIPTTGEQGSAWRMMEICIPAPRAPAPVHIEGVIGIGRLEFVSPPARG
jgi:hypothetical protein